MNDFPNQTSVSLFMSVPCLGDGPFVFSSVPCLRDGPFVFNSVPCLRDGPFVFSSVPLSLYCSLALFRDFQWDINECSNSVCTYSLVILSGSCAIIIAMKINKHPRSSLILICSLKINQPASTANTDSRLISMDAIVGFMCC